MTASVLVLVREETRNRRDAGGWGGDRLDPAVRHVTQRLDGKTPPFERTIFWGHSFSDLGGSTVVLIGIACPGDDRRNSHIKGPALAARSVFDKFTPIRIGLSVLIN